MQETAVFFNNNNTITGNGGRGIPGAGARVGRHSGGGRRRWIGGRYLRGGKGHKTGYQK